MEFHVNFYDGKSSKNHKATLKVSSSNWSISYLDDSKSLIVLNWSIYSIKKSTVYTSGWVSFTYENEFPFQKIESDDAQFITYINTAEHKNLKNKTDVFLHSISRKSLASLIVLLFGITAGMYLFVIPTVATNFASTMSKKNVISFGDYVFRVLSTDLDIDEDKTEKLQDLVDALEINSEFPTQVYVANSKIVNAFAVSGGKFVIFSSLLEKMERKEQLIALIGHEISHIENRHPLKSVARNLSGAIFLSVLFSDVSGVTSILAENAHLFSQLSYTRDLEKEADIFGMELMRKNQLDLHGMPELFKILQEESLFDVPTYLSSHPMLKDRISYTEEIANKQKNPAENKILEEKWDLLKQSLSKKENSKKPENNIDA